MKMKMKFFQLAIVIALVSFTACNKGAGQINGNVSLNNELDSVSYGLGIDIGKSLVRSGMTEINSEAFLAALTKAMSGDTNVLIAQQDAQTIIRAYFEKARMVKLQKNLEEGRKWLEENKKKEGIITTESGLQYKVVKKGTGQLPTDEDVVKVNYKGTLIDGTKFDSSYDRNQPFETKVAGRIIKGWKEALKLMPVGSKYIFYVPTELAYGQNVRPGGPIEPNVPLIFEMELLEIVPQTPDNNKTK